MTDSQVVSGQLLRIAPGAGLIAMLDVFSRIGCEQEKPRHPFGDRGFRCFAFARIVGCGNMQYSISAK